MKTSAGKAVPHTVLDSSGSPKCSTRAALAFSPALPHACQTHCPCVTFCSPALAFVRTACHLLGLDSAVSEDVALVRRRLLKILGVGEFGSAAQFREPCMSFRLPDVICGWVARGTAGAAAAGSMQGRGGTHARARAGPAAAPNPARGLLRCPRSSGRPLLTLLPPPRPLRSNPATATTAGTWTFAATPSCRRASAGSARRARSPMTWPRSRRAWSSCWGRASRSTCCRTCSATSASRCARGCGLLRSALRHGAQTIGY
jgi:hypothetical protein